MNVYLKHQLVCDINFFSWLRIQRTEIQYTLDHHFLLCTDEKVFILHLLKWLDQTELLSHSTCSVVEKSRPLINAELDANEVTDSVAITTWKSWEMETYFGSLVGWLSGHERVAPTKRFLTKVMVEMLVDFPLVSVSASLFISAITACYLPFLFLLGLLGASSPNNCPL